jgi:hypothetical protein
MGSRAEKTNPDLWQRVKAKLWRGKKGGEPGQWSARKAQFAVQQYKRAGGGYRGAKPSDNHLAEWTREEWGTKSGARSRDTGERYLPKRVRQRLTDREYARTSEKKRVDKAKGRQFSSQPRDVARKAARYRRTAASVTSTRAELLEEARARGIPGRSRMRKAGLIAALRRGP